ncbi:Miltiradiene synthase ksl1, chloroplastic [Salvia divinorum]|uniref:Kaurene synthase-like 2 n=1 Tax=Salvia divinorum TaxID=28513 RepID=A0A1S5RW74_SALDI|nr:kaurene synthase-like 2 [Salvia divinorum]
MSLAFTIGVTPFSGHRVGCLSQTFPVVKAIAKKSYAIGKSSLTTTDLLGELKEKLKGEEDDDSRAAATVPPSDIPSSLCIIDTLERLGVDRHFQSEIDTILEDTYRLWQKKHKVIYSSVTTHAMAFRLLRVKGYEVSSEELAPYADQERVSRQTTDVAMVIELYRAAYERMYEDESGLEKILAWTTTFLKHQLQSNSIPDKKLHQLVEFYLKNYNGITKRIAARRNLDLYDMSYYQALKPTNRFSNLCNEDFLVFARHDFNICQAQNQKDLQQLQRWYADCRLDTLKYGREAILMCYFLASLAMEDPELSYVRVASASNMVLVTCFDDFFDVGGSRQESYKIIELVKEWKEKPVAEYGSKEVEILFQALYNTVNEVAEMAGVEQGRGVKGFLVELWIEMLLAMKIELDTWTDGVQLSLDEYMSKSWMSTGCRISLLMSSMFLGVKLSEEMLRSEECSDLCRHVSIVRRLLNDVTTFERERKENKGSSVSILIAEGRSATEEEAIAEIKEVVDYYTRKQKQIVYKQATIFPRKFKDIFLEGCKIISHMYSSSDEFTSPQQLMADVKSLIYEPLTLSS